MDKEERDELLRDNNKKDEMHFRKIKSRLYERYDEFFDYDITPDHRDVLINGSFIILHSRDYLIIQKWMAHTDTAFALNEQGRLTFREIVLHRSDDWILNPIIVLATAKVVGMLKEKRQLDNLG